MKIKKKSNVNEEVFVSIKKNKSGVGGLVRGVVSGGSGQGDHG